MSQWAKTYLDDKKKEEEAKRATCQKCRQKGHWTYECTNPRKYLYRPTRTQIMKKKEKLIAKLKAEFKGVDMNVIQEINTEIKTQNSKPEITQVPSKSPPSSSSESSESPPMSPKKKSKRKRRDRSSS
ncbi:Zinc finger CCHC domain-containing protein 10 [Thelohanellus kitauei]|uniref:Zinc finger CCHC domain-containing protein 10 n=1 Tax=Thelohanellus kitauei TaxID=669202 RepID=A0A0C2JBB3_THEKT|nr:Zinc finger CCHC domain-containing protein 10 [Thelohanellus kitauei]